MKHFLSKLVGPSGLLVLVCFFMPWVSVSCNNGAVLIDRASAYDFAEGRQLADRQSEKSPIIYIALAGGALITLGGLRLLAGNSRGAALLSLVGSGLVIVTCIAVYGDMERRVSDARQNGVFARYEFESGYWGTIAGGLLGGVGALSVINRKASKYGDPPDEF